MNKTLLPLLALMLVSTQLPAQPVITTQPTNQIVLNGSNVVFSVAVLGTGPFTYQWQFNGTNLPNNIITTAAGGGVGGDGGAATNASLNQPQGMAFDAFGNLFFADWGNNCIREVDTNGIITTVAGGGVGGGLDGIGDGGAATNASLGSPFDVAFDTFGNLYISDYSNNLVRKVDTNGIITIVAGGGNDGDGGAATNASISLPTAVTFDNFGNLYIGDSGDCLIREVDTNGIISTVAGGGAGGGSDGIGDGGAATNASLKWPNGAAFDASGNLIIADTFFNCIRKVDTNDIITKIAGTGIYGVAGDGYSGDGENATNAVLSFPYGVGFDVSNNLFIADTYNNCIRKIDTSGIITTVVNGGLLNYPSGVAFDAIGNLYITDTENNLIREVHYAGIPSLTLTNISTNDCGNYSVVIWNSSGSVTSTVATLTVVLPPTIVIQPASQGAAIGSDFTFNVGVTGTSPFNYQWLYNGVALGGQTNSTLTLINLTTNLAGAYGVIITNLYGSVTSSVATLTVGWPPNITSQPTNQIILNGSNVFLSVAVSGTGPFTYQWRFNGTNLPNNIITTVAGSGNFALGDGGLATNASLAYATGVAADNAGNFYIADQYNNRIRKVNTGGIITTVAGKNPSGFSGDGGAATNSSLHNPFGVAVSSDGNCFIADTINCRIRKMDTNGVITTVAGNGSPTYAGDGGAATNASLYNPTGVALDAVGNLYIGDTANNLVREVNTNGIITTVAGNGYEGDGGPATNAYLSSPQGVAVDAYGNLFIAESGENRVRRVDVNGIITTVAGNGDGGYSGDGGTATNAMLQSPAGVTVDAFGYLFISDWNNNCIRQVDFNGIITTVAGNGSAAYSGDGGAATNASLHYPFGVALDVFGRLLIADEYNNRIRRIILAMSPVLPINGATTNSAGNYDVIITSPFGSITSSVATLTIVFPPSISAQPQSVIVTNGTAAQFAVSASGTGSLGYQWYFNNNTAVDSGTNATLAFPNAGASRAGNYTCVITNAYGGVTSGIATLTVLTPPGIVTISTNLAVVIGNNVILNAAVSGTGPFIYQWQCNGTNLPNRNNCIRTIAGTSAQSGFSGDGGLATSAVMDGPSGVAIDSSGNVFIADQWNNRVRRVDTNYTSTANGPVGIIKTVAGKGPSGGNGSYSGDGGLATSAGMNLTPVNYPSGVAVDASGNIYICDIGDNRIRKVDTNGIISTIAGTNSSGFSGDGGLAIIAKLNSPSGVAVDTAGNVFIADLGNNRIRKINTNGIITTVAGTNGAGFSGDGGLAVKAKLNSPYGVAVDGSGNLFITDRSNNRIRKVDMNGIITTFAGNGGAGYSGDGGAATNASLNHPYGVAVDIYDDVFIADDSNNRIRMVGITGIITTVAGTGTAANSGDGGSATNANLYAPTGVGLDFFGNLFITVTGNSIVRNVDFGRNPTLQLTNVAATNAGNYFVVVTSPYGSVTSSIAALTVLFPPSITSQPANITVTNGGSANFNVAVSGTAPFSYQWFASSGRSAAAVPIVSSGRVLFAFITSGGAGYSSVPQVHFVGGSGSGAGGTAVVNNGTVISINITSQGSGYTPTPPTIQIDAPSTINTILSDQTNATFTLPAVTSANATNYFVVVTDNHGSVTSATVALTVFLPPQNFIAQNLATGLQMQLTGTPYYPYILQLATSLTPPVNWQPILTNPADANGNWSFTITNLSGVPAGFYRAVGR